jgi:AcrR family transcriptional regulator
MAPRSTRDRPAKTPLSRDAIVDAGMEVLRDEGFEAVTMRRVASALDTGAASLYVYVANASELHQAMFDRVVAEIPVPEVDEKRWREQMRQLGRDVVGVLDRYPGIASVAIAHIPTGEHALRLVNAMIGLLLAGGVPEASAAWAADVVNLYITAAAYETYVQQRMGVPEDRELEEVRETFEQQAGRFPNVERVQWAMFQGDGEQRFDFGLDLMINGLLHTPPPVER